MTERIISNLAESCGRRKAVSYADEPGKWLAYDYATGKFAGQILYCRGGKHVPELCFPLKAKGWHRIYLGIHYGLRSGNHILRVRLSGDNWHDLVEQEVPNQKQTNYFKPARGTPSARPIGRNSLDEVYWRTAHCNGQSLCIAAHRDCGADSSSAALAYIRLVPLRAPDLKEHQREMPRPETRRVMAVYDGTDSPRDDRTLRKWLEPLRASDVSVVAWGASLLDQCFYPTRTGNYLFPKVRFDSLKAAAELCREMGIECLGSMRPNMGFFPPGHWSRAGRSFFCKHPEYWCVAESGEPAGHVSLAFPEARAAQIAILRDYLAGRDLDGVHYLFNRCYPFVAYEQPVVAAFKAEYGKDPRRLPWHDARWIEHRCQYVTVFMRALRAMADEVGRARGRRVKIGLTVMNSLENNALNAFDLKTWLQEGLVDHLMLHPCWSFDLRGDPRVTPATARPIQQLADRVGGGCRVYADLYPRCQPAEHYRQQALTFYKAGIYGVALWDYYQRSPRKSEWAMARLLGHREELKQWRARALSFGRVLPLKSLCGVSTSLRYNMVTNG